MGSVCTTAVDSVPPSTSDSNPNKVSCYAVVEPASSFSPSPGDSSLTDGITWRSIQQLDDVDRHDAVPANSDADRLIKKRYIDLLTNKQQTDATPPTLADVLYYQSSDTGTVGVRDCGHGLYSAFEGAWATHGAVVVSPDDIWLSVQTQFCQYMDANAEALRGLFVEHAGTVELNVLMEQAGEWPLFMRRVMSAIQERCKANVQADFLPAFSCSTDLSSTLQRLAVMDAMQQYFTYRMTIECGITRVGFLGTLDDWTKLRAYVAGLARFHLPESGYFVSLQKWVDAVLVIVDQFIVAYKGEGEPDVTFWNNVMQERQEASSGDDSTYIKGWITTFLVGGDWTRELDVEDIPCPRFNVPVTVDEDGYVYRVRVVGGMSGVEEANNVYRVQSSLAVIQVGEGEQPGGRVNPSSPRDYAAM